MHKKTSPTFLTLLALTASLLGSTVPASADEGTLNIYSYRQAFLIKPLIKAFEDETNISVKIIFSKKGLLQRLIAEGENSPADVILTADINRMAEFETEGLLQSVDSDILRSNIPAQYRDPDGRWFGLTMRARAVYAHKTRVASGELTTYEDLAKPHMKGRVCTRSGKHPYNISLLASVIAARGSEHAETWLRGLKDNLARRPQGNDRAQVKAIYQGECDVSLGNSYYFGKMLTNEKKPEQKQWAAAVNIVFPNQGDRGTHVNVSAAGIVKSSKHVKQAQQLLEFLASPKTQALFAAVNFEYPLKSGVKLHPIVSSWGSFKADDTNLSKIVENHDEATRMMDRVKFDH
ncbi:MAG: iron ABC transporter substrate-binding protein [Rhodospirillaceae bacterium]|nr:MAG: iron ABC transporter substrate-binding protein [Rhodospirillaceae bacterium]